MNFLTDASRVLLSSLSLFPLFSSLKLSAAPPSVLDLSEVYSRERAWTSEQLVCAPVDRVNLFIRLTIEVTAF